MTQIWIPYQERGQTIGDALSCGVDRAVTGDDDRAVAFQLLLDPPVPCATVGDLIDHVKALDDDERRQLLDQKREAAGLPDLEPERARRRWQALNPTVPPLDAEPEPLRVDPATMQLRPSPAEEERQRREEESLKEMYRKRDELKRQDAERLRKLEEQRPPPTTPVGFGPRSA